MVDPRDKDSDSDRDSGEYYPDMFGGTHSSLGNELDANLGFEDRSETGAGCSQDRDNLPSA